MNSSYSRHPSFEGVFLNHFMSGTEWRHIARGDTFQAPRGVTHAVKNTGRETLLLFSTFSPPIR